MITIDQKPCRLDHFGDGTLSLRAEATKGPVRIEWFFEDNEEMAALYFLTNHLRERGAEAVDLYLPYIPNARMDRVRNADEVFTLKYFAKWINQLEFDHVYVKDAHSNVALALIDRVVSLDIGPALAALAGRLLGPGDLVFYPDEGACKRYGGRLNYPSAFGIKNREWRTGEIRSYEAAGDIPQSPFNALIVDDISSYGGTFLRAAAALKKLGADKIWLYVTHCEKNILKGGLPGSGLIEKVFTTNSIFREDNEFVEVLR